VVNFVKEAWSKGEPFELTIPLRGKDGNYRWFLTRVFPVKDKHGKAIQWIGTNTDIDEQKRSEEILEEKVKKRTKELVKVNEELERSSYDLLQFASVASHDLKEPLRKIQSYSNLLLLRYKDKLDSTGQKYCQYLNEGGKRMKNLIDDILSYSKISSETLNFQQIDLNHLLSDIFYDLEILLKETNPKIEIGGLCEIECIPGQIRQVFQNLISNSLKFRKPDITPVITITGKVVKGEELDEKLEKGASYCKIEVKDNGIGFGMKYIEQIFTLFKRLHSKDEYAGTGIGLAIVKKIIEKHHGRITADSVLGEGALFTVILPIKQISD
jgi:two-component system, chemotaxis family, CheB/CheR fusion protein